MTKQSYYLAMLPFDHFYRQIDPFERYRLEDFALTQPYRAVVNAGVRAYQLTAYIELVHKCFGPFIKRLVRKQQRLILDSFGEPGGHIGTALKISMRALETQPIRIQYDDEAIDVPLEMNVALLLLLDSPLSPDHVSDPARRVEQIGLIGNDADWRFTEYLIRGRKAINDSFAPIFDEIHRDWHSTSNLRDVGAH